MMGFGSWLQKYRKRKRIGAYVTRLRPVLVRQSGKANYYKPEQVKQAAKEARLPMGFFGTPSFGAPYK